jgi:hypothetical protein
MGIHLPVGRRVEVKVMVDDIKVTGAFLKQTHASDWIEVRMEHPYKGSWLVRPCFVHRSPLMLMVECIHFAAKLKLELEYRKMKAIDAHYAYTDLNTPVSRFSYPEI